MKIDTGSFVKDAPAHLRTGLTPRLGQHNTEISC